ncbi:hypothetical protein NDR87_03990 [Nocardia sp. CDC159]|uniref:Beta-ketoacyl synthase-like N-terminal domain-containing protein n=1 Tax=Nocardia pulmonis TaxID=2951408 RepID=A0A9X2E2Y8_9NOCA|nr:MULTISPECIES: beta-ketoacyl synthase N-terminal-like domain-containing protein [Nocardia]MCM6773177.1 hypothetical protein [Nocardia pulmonis]MCM6785520.1 hypothetical protein [Nocardia sp. CDC159]
MNTVITAWDTHSPLGRTAEDHARSLRRGMAAAAGPRRVVDFDIREALGKKGTRSMDRATGLAVATVGQLLERNGLGRQVRAADSDAEIGLVLGTSDSVQALVDFTRDTWTRAKPYDVEPAKIPVNLMNFHAGQCAIWHRLKGPNSTICGSHVGTLLALNYARRLRSNGHAHTVICGAVEECSSARATYEAARAGDEPRREAGEGCVVFLLESADIVGAGRAPLAELLAIEFGVYAPDALRTALSDCLRRALLRAGVEARDVRMVAPSPNVGERGDNELDAIADVFGDVALASAGVDALGDTRAVSAGFQLVELLVDAGEPGRIAAVTSTDDEGRVGCALIRTC